jgi:hypothetical protein
MVLLDLQYPENEVAGQCVAGNLARTIGVTVI